MGKPSKAKGRRGEQEVVKLLRAHNFPARRTPYSGASEWKGDVLGLPGYALEVKLCQKWDVPAWLRQAHAAASSVEIPALVIRRAQKGPADVCSMWHTIVPTHHWLSEQEELAGWRAAA